MTYRYTLQDLLNVLKQGSPQKVAMIEKNNRRVEHGLLTVGLKIHYTGDNRLLTPLVAQLGGSDKILEINAYKKSRTAVCLVLPPVGNARSAVALLECIGHFVGSDLFNNRDVQIQVCSPARLSLEHSALLAIGFYLGSDTLQHYELKELQTTFTENVTYPRGRRLILYDACGDFDNDFAWWGLPDPSQRNKGFKVDIKNTLPFSNRTDVLTGTSPIDIYNINLVATLLAHHEYKGCWYKLGEAFKADMKSLLKEHQLQSILHAPWVYADEESHDDGAFYDAFQQLSMYAHEEVDRLMTSRRARGEDPDGILQDMHNILSYSRREVQNTSSQLKGVRK